MRKSHFLRFRIVFLCLFLLSVFTTRIEGQYFGQNKVQYDHFKFNVLKTDHFQIYYYDEEKEAVELVARMAERWYTRLSGILKHEFKDQQPLILYASHPHFQQTNVLTGMIGEGTGGVTESFKRRVIMPLAGPLQETDHVLGHELVHAFQYDISGVKGPMAAGRSRLTRLPLWFIEGMAEYLSIGSTDPHTAMWMREAARKNKLPTISKMASPEYFPYRYGQALWAYVAGRYGDEVVHNILRNANRLGVADESIKSMIKMDADTLTHIWHEAIKTIADSVASRTQKVEDFGRLLIGKSKQEGDIYLSPSLSPDGKHIIFLSTRDLFSIDLYLADVETGKILERVTRTDVDPHFQSIQFLHSSGAWDADGKRFAFAAISNGKPVLSIYDIGTMRVTREVVFERLNEIMSPTWAADGNHIAFSALTGGLTDLFVYDLESDSLKRLTHDVFTDIQPSWAPDGKSIAFVTDRFSSNLETLDFGQYELALLDPETGSIQKVRGFAGGKHINPQWSYDSERLYFISDRDGISNIYSIHTETEEMRQITNLFTGVSGITGLSPALASSQGSHSIAFTVYSQDGYHTYFIEDTELLAGTPIVDRFSDSRPDRLLHPVKVTSAVDSILADPVTGLPIEESFETERYRSRLSLDYVAPPSMIIGADRFGSVFGGGTALYWSDMLSNHNLMTMLQIDSRFRSIAGVLGYTNRTRRMDWGLTAAQIPYTYTQYLAGFTEIQGESAYVEQILLLKQVNRSLSAVASYPLSRVQRIEAAASYLNIGFSYEVETIARSLNDGSTIIDESEKLPSPRPLHIGQGSLAWIYDSALYGATGPLMGQRYRFEVSPTFGTLRFSTVLADYRRYFMPFRPFTFAFRAVHYGRYGKDAEDRRLNPLFIGYQGFIRGYENYSFSADECSPLSGGDCFDYNRLWGSKMLVGNVELRFPLFGTLGLGKGYYGFLPIDMALFFDAGVAWSSFDKASFLGGERQFIKSYGVAFRMNVFGYLIMELDIVKPIDRPQKGFMLQFGLTQGF